MNSRLGRGILTSGGLALFLFSAALTQDVEQLNQQGVRLLKAGRVVEAVQLFEKAARLAPSNASVHYNLAVALYQAGREAEALQALEKASVDPEILPKVQLLRGTILFGLRQYSDALQALSSLPEPHRNTEQVLYMMVESARQVRDAELASRAFQELSRRFPDSAFLHKLLAMALEAQDRDEEALEEFQAALRAMPNMPDVAFGIGYIHFKHQRFAEARQWFEQELKIQPCLAPALHYLGEIAGHEENWEKALKLYHQAIACQQDYIPAHLAAGLAHERLGNLAAAREAYERAVKLAPHHAQARFRLGNLLARVGEHQRAREELRLAQELFRKEQDRQALERERRQRELTGASLGRE